MPEGAEVKTNSDQLAKLILGKEVSLVPLSGKLQREGVKHHGAEPVRSHVTGVSCKGKLIYVDFASGERLTSTLGMSGWWYPANPPAADQVAYVSGKGAVYAADVWNAYMKYARASFISDGETLAYFCDPRNFGNINVWGVDQKDEPLAKIGCDLLAASHNLKQAHWPQTLAKLKARVNPKSKVALCELLLDQSVLAGLGNIYRAETLYLSKIDPFKAWKDLTEDEKDRLITNSCVILNIAYFTKGTMFYPQELLRSNGHAASQNVYGHLVYGKAKTPSGEKVVNQDHKGRTIWFAPMI